MTLAASALIFLLASLVVGQLIRLPLPGQGGGLLLSDVATVVVLLAAYVRWLKHPNKFGHWSASWRIVFGVFILWSLFTLVIQIPILGSAQALIAAAYWVRLTVTLLLLPALLLLFQNSSLRTFGRRAFLFTVFILAFLGFLQLAFFPNLWDLSRIAPALAGAKWDPHQGRLVSTWLDPNFIGAFFAMVLPLLVGRGFFSLKGVGVLVVLIALLLTQSRSSLIALAFSLLISAPLWFIALRKISRWYTFVALIAGSSALLSLLLFPALLAPGRLFGLLLIDDTASLRLQSLASAWQLVQAHPWVGVGYNAYQFAARDAGFISGFTLHSRSGTDNSALTLWVTTGIIGVILFFLPWAAIASLLSRRAAYGNLTAAAAVTSLVTLFIHSQFVNSFLYTHLLLALIIIVTLALTSPVSES